MAAEDPVEQTVDQTVEQTKDKFRAALERKRNKQHATNEAKQNESKVHGEHGRAGAKRTFRRKSGG